MLRFSLRARYASARRHALHVYATYITPCHAFIAAAAIAAATPLRFMRLSMPCHDILCRCSSLPVIQERRCAMRRDEDVSFDSSSSMAFSFFRAI